jgi:hypothetical protein
MVYLFTKDDVGNISETLGLKPQEFDRGWTWRLHNKETGQQLIFSIYTNIQLENNESGNLITVQTQHGYFELHNCTMFMLFEPDEVIFIQHDEVKLSSLIIGRQSTCSMFTNINREILSHDFSELDPPLLLSAMQLSIAESVL